MEDVLRKACNTPALCKLNALVRNLTGVGLLVVWSRSGETFGQVPVCNNERELPQFCRLLHEVPQGHVPPPVASAQQGHGQAGETSAERHSLRPQKRPSARSG